MRCESEEVDARIRAVRHNRCRVPLRLALLSSGYVAITRRPTSESSYTTASVVVVVVAVAVGAVAVAVVAAAALAAPPAAVIDVSLLTRVSPAAQRGSSGGRLFDRLKKP